jgi:hypothetical protein
MAVPLFLLSLVILSSRDYTVTITGKPKEAIVIRRILYLFHLKMQDSAGIINTFKQGVD